MYLLPTFSLFFISKYPLEDICTSHSAIKRNPGTSYFPAITFITIEVCIHACYVTGLSLASIYIFTSNHVYYSQVERL